MCGDDRVGGDVDRDFPGGLDLDVRLAGRQLEARVDDKAPVDDLLDRLPGEIEPDLAAIGLGLALRMVMNLDDDIALRAATGRCRRARCWAGCRAPSRPGRHGSARPDRRSMYNPGPGSA